MVEVHTETVIQAPPEHVWQILIDFPGHDEWNPFLRFGRGATTVGERLDVEVRPPGGRPMRFRPRLVAFEPNRHFAWLGTAGIRGIFDGRHEFTLKPAGDGTLLRQSEVFGGLLPPLMGGMIRRSENGFRAMNDALRTRAESGVRS